VQASALRSAVADHCGEHDHPAPSQEGRSNGRRFILFRPLGLNAHATYLNVIGKQPREPQHRGVQGEHGELLRPGEPHGGRRQLQPMQVGLGVAPDRCRRCSARARPETRRSRHAAIQGTASSWFATATRSSTRAMAAFSFNANGCSSPLTGCPSRVDADGSHDRQIPDNGKTTDHCGAAGVLRAPSATTQVRDVDQLRDGGCRRHVTTVSRCTTRSARRTW